MDLTAILIPILIGLFLGTETLGGMLGGPVTSGMITSFLVNNLDVKVGNEDSHVVVSSVNVLIKYMTITSLVLGPVFNQFGNIIAN